MALVEQMLCKLPKLAIYAYSPIKPRTYPRPEGCSTNYLHAWCSLPMRALMDLISRCGLLFPIITSRHAKVGKMEEACNAFFESQENYIKFHFYPLPDTDKWILSIRELWEDSSVFFRALRTWVIGLMRNPTPNQLGYAISRFGFACS